MFVFFDARKAREGAKQACTAGFEIPTADDFPACTPHPARQFLIFQNACDTVAEGVNIAGRKDVAVDAFVNQIARRTHAIAGDYRLARVHHFVQH